GALQTRVRKSPDMRLGLRVQVAWDGATIEDVVHARRAIRIGSGPRAHVVVPGPPGSIDRYARFVQRGPSLELLVEPGVVDEVALDGEEPIDAASLQTSLELRLDPTRAAGRLRAGDVIVEFERVRFAKEVA